MEVQTILDYVLKLLAVILTWPVAAVVLGMLFRPQISNAMAQVSDVIRRIRKAKALGQEFELDQPHTTSLKLERPFETNTSAATATAPATPTSLPALAPHAAALVDRIRSDPAFAAAQGPDREELLLRAIADKAVAVAFERIYRAIFGSQLDAMIMANAPGGATEDRLVALFELAKRNNPEIHHERTFEQWIAYPIAELMVEERRGVDGKKLYVTTPQGRDFMHYFVSQGLGHKLG